VAEEGVLLFAGEGREGAWRRKGSTVFPRGGPDAGAAVEAGEVLGAGWRAVAEGR